jgi:hypothetical protein
MSVDLTLRAPAFPNVPSQGGAVSMAVISEEEFAWAQVVVPDLAYHLGYQDWLDCREGFQIGLAMAGVEVKTIEVVLSPFLAWCRLTDSAPSERALDLFASAVLMMRAPPSPFVLAVVRQEDFNAHAHDVGAFVRHVSFDRWRLHRARIAEKLKESGGRVEELPVRIEDFIEWSKCLGEKTDETVLDIYATLVMEYLATELAA